MGVRDYSIKQHLLTPLSELYGELAPEQEAHYLEALKSATDTELKETFIYLRDNYDYAKFPKIPDVQKARKIVAAPRAGAMISRDFTQRKQPWDLRQERHDAAVKAYAESFCSSALYAQGSREGWCWPLEDYVKAVASVQMNLIIAQGEKHNWGYDSVKIFGISSSNHPVRKHREAEFWRTCKEQAATGRIEVTVPSYRIDDWRREAEYKRRDDERLRAQRAAVTAAPAYAQQPDRALQKRHISAPVTQAVQKAAIAADMPAPAKMTMTPEVAFFAPLRDDSNALPVHKPVKSVNETVEIASIPPVF